LAGGFTSLWRRGRKHVFNYLIDYLDGKFWGYYYSTSDMIGVKWMPGRWAVTGGRR